MNGDDEQDPVLALLRGSLRAAELRNESLAERDYTTMPGGPVPLGMNSHSAAYLLSALKEAGWELRRIDRCEARSHDGARCELDPGHGGMHRLTTHGSIVHFNRSWDASTGMPVPAPRSRP